MKYALKRWQTNVNQNKNTKLYPCWVCSNNVSSGASVGCEDCDAWAHAKCVKLPDTVIGYLNKGYRIGIKVYCDSCLSKKDQNGVLKEIRELKQIMETQRDHIHILTGNIDNVNKEMKLMTAEMKQMTAEMKLINNENKGLKKICSEIRDENMNAKSRIPATNTQTPSYANIAKKALIVKSADSGSITGKKVQIAKALSEVPIDKTREKTNGALIMNFRDKTNIVAAHAAGADLHQLIRIKVFSQLKNATICRIKRVIWFSVQGIYFRNSP